MLNIIAAIDDANALGFENKLLFYLPADLKRFKALTTGHTIIMGRKTFESLPKGALPNRRNIVLSRKGKAEDFPGAELFGSLEDALTNCQQEEEVFVIGGESIYRQAMDKAQQLRLTEIHETAKEADAFFPTIDKNQWKEMSREKHEPDEKNHYHYDFVDYVRR